MDPTRKIKKINVENYIKKLRVTELNSFTNYLKEIFKVRYLQAI